MNSHNDWGIIDRFYQSLQIIQSTVLFPFIQHGWMVLLCSLFWFFWVTDLSHDWHIVKWLDFSFIIVVILNSNNMSESLIIRSESVLINPLAIIWTQSVKINPQSSRPVSNNSLWPVCIDRYFIIFVLDEGKSSHWIWVSINVIEFSWIKMSLIIFMMEKLSF